MTCNLSSISFVLKSIYTVVINIRAVLVSHALGHGFQLILAVVTQALIAVAAVVYVTLADRKAFFVYEVSCLLFPLE